MLFSDDLKVFDGELSKAVNECINQIRDYFSLDEIKVLQYDSSTVAVPVLFTVPIPPKGTVDDIDIRPEEPVLVCISINNYPYTIPYIESDRKDFPKKNLPHLYATQKHEPARLCLVRNNPHEWFANKSIHDLLNVACQWLFKAAIGRLLDDGDEFDPTMLVNIGGYHAFKYDMVYNIVKNKQQFIPHTSISLLLTYGRLEKGRLIYRSLSPIPYLKFPAFLEALRKNDVDNILTRTLFTIIVWDSFDNVYSDYDIDLPKNYLQLKEYFSQYNIDIEYILNVYMSLNCQVNPEISIIHAVKRPKKIIGYAGEYEFINFLIYGSGFSGNKRPNETDVHNLKHIEPFSSELATKLSGETQNHKKYLFVGAGSLGSKIILHAARSGLTRIGVVDNDTLLEHNMVRHSLNSYYVGMNKATAIAQEIKSLQKVEMLRELHAYETRVNNLPKSEITKYDIVVDTTAGIDTLNWFCNEELSENTIVKRGEIADDGQLGLFYVEGARRNPRIDDLVNLAYFKASTNQSLQDWRKRDVDRVINNIDIGLGCSSSTTIMPDDIISFHASTFSRILYRSGSFAKNGEGLLYLNTLNDEGIPIQKSEYYLVEAFEIYMCNADSGWQVRMMNGLSTRLINLSQQKGEIETGGVLVGMANYKTKTIHIFDIITEPKGSSGSPSKFIRAVGNLPKELDAIKENTGNMIGYIGEWHSHPMGLEQLSKIDQEAIENLTLLNRNIPIPTCSMIVTNGKIIPFIFE